MTIDESAARQGGAVIQLVVNIPRFVEKLILWILLVYRRLRYGDKSRLIPLTQGKFAIVDAEDYEKLNRYKWHAIRQANTFYAVRRQGNKKIRMHRVITNAPKGLDCDHIDHNGLNNRKKNLRLCTRLQNSRNQRARKGGTSKYKGVYWHKDQKKWHAGISSCGKSYFLGSFDNEVDAAKAYDKKAKVLFGQFACLNFPDTTENNN
jgi:hypothetical protein